MRSANRKAAERTMKPATHLGAAAGLALILSPAFAQSDAPVRAIATLHGINGAELGAVEFTQTPHGLLIEIDAGNLSPGSHAIHVHEKGECNSANGFESAGDHFAPGGTTHGYMTVHGPHAGDMPNQTVGRDGKLQAGIFDPKVTLTKGEHSLFDNDGSSLV